MEETDASAEEAGIWWMQEFADVWTAWLDNDVAQKVLDAIN